MKFQSRRALKKRIQFLEKELKKARSPRWLPATATSSSSNTAGANVSYTLHWGEEDEGPGYAHRPVA